MAQSASAPGAVPVAPQPGPELSWEDLLGVGAVAPPDSSQQPGPPESSDSSEDLWWKWKWKGKKKLLWPGQPGSMAVDAQGHPHFFFYSSDLDGLQNTWTDGVEWFSEVVDPDAGYSTGVAATDGSGALHVAYMILAAGGMAFELRHARKDGDTWTIETADTGGANPSMVFDETGAVHILHVSPHDYGVPDQVRYVVQTPTGWQSETIDTTTVNTDRTCVLLDGTKVYALYTVGDWPPTLRLATRVAGVWSKEDIDLAEWPSMALDEDGVLHVVYQALDGTITHLEHAWLMQSVWHHETLVSQSSFFGYKVKQGLHASADYPVMLKDFAGRLYLAFGLFVSKGQAWGSGLTVALLHDGVWVPRKVGPNGSGFGVEMGVAPSGIVHVATGKVTSKRGGTIYTTALELKGRKLSLAVDPPGAGTITDELTGLQCTDKAVEQIYPWTHVTLTATPAPGYTFVEWAKDGWGSGSTCQVTMFQARKVEARFAPSP